MTNAVYALSADPITYGHIDVITRAARMFDQVFVAIGSNPNKQYMFDGKTRLNMAESALAKLPNVTISLFEGMLVDFALQQDIKVIVRGIRNGNDMDFEKSLHATNRQLCPNIDTLCLFSDPSRDHISSSMVKAVMKDKGSVADMVPARVKFELERTISKQFIIGVTGIMGSGKSYFAEQLVACSERHKDSHQDKHLDVHNIELDDVAKDILYSPQYSKRYLRLRKQVKARFGTNEARDMANVLFASQDNVDAMRTLIKPYIDSELRERMRQLTGIVLINSATLIESGMLATVSNQLLLVHTTESQRINQLQIGRGYSEEQANRRLQYVLDVDAKLAVHKKTREQAGHGFQCVIDGCRLNQSDYITETYHNLIERFYTTEKYTK
jgi:pantetheine-phosphate adenylyltransferase